MNQNATQDISLLILEQGAEWPSWATGIRMRASNSAVEAQLDGEPTSAFEERVVLRMNEIAKRGMRLMAAGYACALRAGDRWSIRRELCHRIVTQLHPDERSELVLAGGTWATTGEEGIERTRLIELWSELSALQTGRMLSIRFEDAANESGVFHAASRLHETMPLARTDGPRHQADQLSKVR